MGNNDLELPPLSRVGDGWRRFFAAPKIAAEVVALQARDALGAAVLQSSSPSLPPHSLSSVLPVFKAKEAATSCDEEEAGDNGAGQHGTPVQPAYWDLRVMGTDMREPLYIGCA